MYNTRERILNAALHCFAQNGYEAASISDIASQLGISKGALYRHFANKRAYWMRSSRAWRSRMRNARGNRPFRRRNFL